MTLVSRAAALALALCAPAGQVTATAPDICQSKIPADLKRAVLERFPGYTLPRMSDNLAGDIAYNKQDGGDGCLGVAAGDFNADGRSDYALLVTASDKAQTHVVVALKTEEGWRLDCVRTWKGERFRLFVATAPPGIYRQTESHDQPQLEPGEVESHESKVSGIVTGRTEASGIYYFLTDRGWIHVWVVD